jgi:hypothetical protein
MASTNNVIFPESMADILSNPVDICFSSMPAKSTTPVVCLIIEGNAVTADQQIGMDLLTETHPPTPSDLIAGIDRVEGMLSNTIKVCERVKRPRTTSSPSSVTTPPEIIPYYRLNHSIWSLSDNKESSRFVLPG